MSLESLGNFPLLNCILHDPETPLCSTHCGAQTSSWRLCLAFTKRWFFRLGQNFQFIVVQHPIFDLIKIILKSLFVFHVWWWTSWEQVPWRRRLIFRDNKDPVCLVWCIIHIPWIFVRKRNKWLSKEMNEEIYLNGHQSQKSPDLKKKL